MKFWKKKLNETTAPIAQVAERRKSECSWIDIMVDSRRNDGIDLDNMSRRVFQRTDKDLRVIGSQGETVSAMDAMAQVTAQDSANTSFLSKDMYSLQSGMNPIVMNFFTNQSFIGYQACAMLFQNNTIAAACQIPVEDALRPDYEISICGDDNDNGQLDSLDDTKLKELKRLSNDQFKLNDVLTKFGVNNRIFGIAIAVPIIDGIDYALPFNPDGIKQNSYHGITVIEPYWCVPTLDLDSSTNPASPNFYEPTYWVLRNGLKIHHSHVFRLIYMRVPDILKPTYYYGGIPLTQLIYERIYAAEKCANEAPTLAMTKRLRVVDADIDNFIADPANAQEILSALTYCQDNYGVLLKRADGQVSQIDTSLADFDALIMTQYQLVAMIARMPATKLLKTTPKGFNSIGEFEQKDYAQTLQAIEALEFSPLIRRHYQILAKSLWGIDVMFDVSWNPVDAPTEQEKTTNRETESRRLTALIGAGIITPEEARTSLKADEESGFNALSDEIEQPLPEDYNDVEFEQEPQQEPTSDKSVSEAQHRAMESAAHGKSTLGIPEKVGKEFVSKDVYDGGEGSGDFDHDGRVGKVGGSSEQGSGREYATSRKDAYHAFKSGDISKKTYENKVEKQEIAEGKEPEKEKGKEPEKQKETPKEESKKPEEKQSVSHERFGKGEIQKIEGNMVEVKFEDGVTRKVMRAFLDMPNNAKAGTEVKITTLNDMGVKSSKPITNVIKEEVKKETSNLPKKGDFTVKKETKKAYLLSKDDKTFWVQKRWLSDDGKLTPAGQKAYNEAETTSQTSERIAKENESRKEGIGFNKAWENDKAVGVDIDIAWGSSLGKTQRLFFPKSQIQPNGNIPTWLIEAKLKELNDKLPNGWFFESTKNLKGWNKNENKQDAEDFAFAQDKDETKKDIITINEFGEIVRVEDENKEDAK